VQRIGQPGVFRQVGGDLFDQVDAIRPFRFGVILELPDSMLVAFRTYSGGVGEEVLDVGFR
jgi:hypothetical protein